VNFEDIRIKDVRCVVRYLPKQTQWHARNRQDHIIGIKLSGIAHHDFGYQSFDMAESCIFFFNQRDDYSVKVIENGESLSVHFTTYEDIDTDSFCIPLTGGGEFLRILEKTEAQSKLLGTNNCMMMSLVYRLCAELCRQREKQYSPRDSRMNHARAYIDIHFRDASCLADAVSLSGLSARRFGELFRLNFDVTPNRYIVLRRVGYAGELLKSKSFSVSEVAEICGFCDVYYFSRVFKNETGVSPKDWK